MKKSYTIVVLLLLVSLDALGAANSLTRASFAHIGRFIRAEKENDLMYYTTTSKKSLERVINNILIIQNNDAEFEALTRKIYGDRDDIRLILTKILDHAQYALNSNDIIRDKIAQKIESYKPISKIGASEHAEIKKYLKDARERSQKMFMAKDIDALQRIIDLSEAFLNDQEELKLLIKAGFIALSFKRLNERLIDLITNAKRAIDLKSKYVNKCTS